MESDDLISRLKKLMVDDSNVAFAKKVGISEGAIRHILKGQSPNLDTLGKIARACGVRMSWLAGGAPMDYSHDADVVDIPAVKQDLAIYCDSLYIEHYPSVKAAAGAGRVTETDQISVMLAVNAAEWRARVGLNPKNVKVITVYGDSMNPTLSHGDQVLVDTACNSFIDDAIYALQQGDLLRIKRVKLNLDGSITVKSDNENGFTPEVYSQERAAEFNIVGKVLPFKFGQFKI